MQSIRQSTSIYKYSYATCRKESATIWKKYLRDSLITTGETHPQLHCTIDSIVLMIHFLFSKSPAGRQEFDWKIIIIYLPMHSRYGPSHFLV